MKKRIKKGGEVQNVLKLFIPVVGTPPGNNSKHPKPKIPSIKERINAYLKQLNNTQ